MKKKRLKAIISTLLILCLLYLAVTGALMYFGKTGVVMGIARNTLRGSHFWVAFTTVILSIVHLALNFRVFIAEGRAALSGQKPAGRGEVKRTDTRAVQRDVSGAIRSEKSGKGR